MHSLHRNTPAVLKQREVRGIKPTGIFKKLFINGKLQGGGWEFESQKKVQALHIYFIYNAMLVSAYSEVNQPYVYICPFPLAPSHPPLEVVTEQLTGSSPSGIQRLPLAVYFTHGHVYTSGSLFQVTHPLLPVSMRNGTY